MAGGSTRIPLISESLFEVFKDSIICNFLNVDEVCTNCNLVLWWQIGYFKVAAIGAAAIVSKTVTVAEKFIDYEKIIKIIKEQEEEEEKKCNPPSMSALGAGSASGANKNHVGNNQSPKVVIKIISIIQ